MAKIKNLLYKYRFAIGGAILGALGGYLYYHFIGCNSGSCAITSKPANSTLYGAVMGILIGNIFKTQKPKAADSDPLETENNN